MHLQTLGLMRTLYSNMEDVDLWVGGMMETTAAGPGETFRAIILDQFRRIRDGDRFWFENYKLNGYAQRQLSVLTAA